MLSTVPVFTSKCQASCRAPYSSVTSEFTAHLHSISPQRLRIDDPLMITVNVGIEPTDIRTFFKLLQPTYNPDNTIHGMFQINTIEKISEDVKIEEKRIVAWKAARAREPPNTQVVLVQFKRSGHLFSWTTTLTIAPISLAIARQRPPLRQNSAIYGESEVPMNEASIIEYVVSLYQCLSLVNLGFTL